MAKRKKPLSPQWFLSEDPERIRNGLEQLGTRAQDNPSIVKDKIGFPRVNGTTGELRPALTLERSSRSDDTVRATHRWAISFWALCWGVKHRQIACPERLILQDIFSSQSRFNQPSIVPLETIQALKELRYLGIGGHPVSGEVKSGSMYFWKHQKKARLQALIPDTKINWEAGWDRYWEQDKYWSR